MIKKSIFSLFILLGIILGQDKEMMNYNEFCFTIDVSTSMLGLDRPDREGTIEDIICFIKNKIQEIDLKKSKLIFLLYAQDTLLFQFPNPVNENKVKIFLDELVDDIHKKRKNNQYFYFYSNLTKAVLSSFKTLVGSPANTFQEIYLFTDNDHTMPSREGENITWKELEIELDNMGLSPENMRNFYYFPLFSSGLNEIKKICSEEGGETYENMAKIICETFVYDTVTVEFKVLNSLLSPIYKANIISTKSKHPFITDSLGKTVMQIKTQIPHTLQFVVGKTGYQNSYTHAFVDKKKKNYHLNSVILQPQPIRINIIFHDLSQFPIQVILKNFSPPIRKNIDKDFNSLFVYKHVNQLDKIDINIITAKNDTIIEAIEVLEWKNNYELIINE